MSGEVEVAAPTALWLSSSEVAEKASKLQGTYSCCKSQKNYNNKNLSPDRYGIPATKSHTQFEGQFIAQKCGLIYVRKARLNELPNKVPIGKESDAGGGGEGLLPPTIREIATKFKLRLQLTSNC